MKNILIATDFSANARHAAIYGYKLAQQLNTNIILCNAFLLPAPELAAGLALGPAYQDEELTQDNTRMLNELKDELQEWAGLAAFKPMINCENEPGTVSSVLKDIVGHKHISLIVIGMHGNNALSEFLVGENSLRLINDTTVPLLLVPPNAKIAAIKKIALATDFVKMEKDIESIYELIALLRPLDAELLITHIQNGAGNAEESKKRIEKFINDITHKTGYSSIFRRIIMDIKNEDGLDWVYEHEYADMLVMVHRKHNFLERLVASSFTENAARQITTPLLVIPAKR